MRLIDADEVMKFPIRANKCDKENANEHFVYGIETVLEYVEQLPTIEPKRGMWLPRNSGFLYWVRCSVCDEKYYGYSDKCNFKYCPNCGAKMGGDEQ